MNYFNKKLNSPFKKFDILLYLIALIIIGTCFLVVGLLSNNQPKSGFKVYQNDVVIMDFNFSSKTYEFYNDGNSRITYSLVGDVYSFTIYTDESLTHYNLLQVNAVDKTATITESNCPSKDCHHLNLDTGIVCVPHHLKIVSLGSGDNIVTG